MATTHHSLNQLQRIENGQENTWENRGLFIPRWPFPTPPHRPEPGPPTAPCCPFSLTMVVRVQPPLSPTSLSAFAAWLIPTHFSDLCSDTISFMRPDLTPSFPGKPRTPFGSHNTPCFPILGLISSMNCFTT